MKTKRKIQKEGLKIVSRPSNEEIEEDENGNFSNKNEKQTIDDELSLNHQEQGKEDG